MKLKTLLLGSAAAMIAVSGARAADAVIAEKIVLNGFMKFLPAFLEFFWISFSKRNFDFSVNRNPRTTAKLI